MKYEDKELLKAEIEKYIRRENYDCYGEVNFRIHTISDVETAFRDKREGMRLLLDNKFGLLGNLMFKYVRDEELDISSLIKELDTKLILDAYEKYGENFYNNVGTWYVMKVILRKDPKLVEKLDWFVTEPALAYEIAEYCPWIMKNVVPRVRKFRDFTFNMVKINPDCLEHAFWCYKADKEIALEAVRRNPELICHTDASLRGDKELMMLAVKHRGLLLSYANESIKGDPEIVRAAVENNWLSLRFASDRLQQDIEIKTIAEESRRRMGWQL